MYLTELLETEHRKELSIQKFKELLREKCKNSHISLKQLPIFKEDKGPDFMLVTPSEREVRSSFWVDKFIKKLDSWRRFPSRTKFIRGFTSIGNVGGESKNHYVVVPYDRAIIGVCPGESFYRSFKNTHKSMGIERIDNDGLATWCVDVASAINELYAEANLEEAEPTTYSEFIKRLNSIDKVIAANKEKFKKLIKNADIRRKETLHDLLDRHVIDTLAYIGEKLDPDQNKFNAIRIESLSSSLGTKEVWISDPCLLIRRSTYLDMYEKGEIQ